MNKMGRPTRTVTADCTAVVISAVSGPWALNRVSYEACQQLLPRMSRLACVFTCCCCAFTCWPRFLIPAGEDALINSRVGSRAQNVRLHQAAALPPSRPGRSRGRRLEATFRLLRPRPRREPSGSASELRLKSSAGRRGPGVEELSLVGGRRCLSSVARDPW